MMANKNIMRAIRVGFHIFYTPNPHVTLQLMSLTSIFGENST